VDLVTIDPAEWIAGERLFPYGHWREPKEALSRADAAIVHSHSAIPELPIPVFAIQTVVEGIYKGNEAVPVRALQNRAVTAFAGIAKPDRFFNSLESMGVAITSRVRFRDHHSYTIRDLESLPGEIHITTEKDAVRLEDLSGRAETDVLHLRISARIPELDRLLALIHLRIREHP
jgi:tetraacyldisaccharide 4'-kinase